ncbi:hypothetical protein FB45DRAFT_1054334 [Roridomyces roridus]|uniref:DUF6699 domain-containing protein n=1 Tax=Roridomyces roridus TaxID=1738132 RepID=A0AAD7C8J5_9AGAR|nr:hypothetical protein FB45DRAFT_1054334 [Roridomyces roridus]
MCFLRCCRRRPKHQTPVLWPPTLVFGRTPHRAPAPPTAFTWTPFTPLPPLPQDYQHHAHFGANPSFLPPTSPWMLPGSVPRQHRRLPDISRPRRLSSRRRRRESPAPFIPPPREWVLPNSPAPLVPGFIPRNLRQQLNPEVSNGPGISWDITQFPATAQRRGRRRRRQGGTGDLLDEPATWPICTFLTISFRHLGLHLAPWEALWGPIQVHSLGTRPITIETVFNAIHAYFRIPLTENDRARVGWAEWTVISDTYRRRVGPMGRSPNLRAYDEQQGPLRSDVLRGETEFYGLISFTGAPEGLYNLVLVAPS